MTCLPTVKRIEEISRLEFLLQNIVVIHFLQSMSSFVLSLASWSAAAFGKGFYWQDVALREEIHRVLDLEAENAALQESLATLPQLQEDRAAYLKLREHLQVSNACKMPARATERGGGGGESRAEQQRGGGGGESR
ncbi:unnamed protein product [Sphagnum jensenii]|uniref:Uncharacterized protein n=1 Tax=Sphagnum jensenii TaxID=128206 RepID=A0ABP1BC58_9BRYO